MTIKTSVIVMPSWQGGSKITEVKVGEPEGAFERDYVCAVELHGSTDAVEFVYKYLKELNGLKMNKEKQA